MSYPTDTEVNQLAQTFYEASGIQLPSMTDKPMVVRGLQAVFARLREMAGPTKQVLDLVYAERVVQEARYGHVNDKLEDGTGPFTRWLQPYTTAPARKIQRDLRADYEDWEEEGNLPTWLHLVREEIGEAFEHPAGPRLEEELIQVAALCVSWVERLRARPPVVQVESVRAD